MTGWKAQVAMSDSRTNGSLNRFFWMIRSSRLAKRVKAKSLACGRTWMCSKWNGTVLHFAQYTVTAQCLDQCFPNLSRRTPCPAPFVCLSYLIHLIPLISSLVETARTKLGVWLGRHDKCAGQGSSRTGLGSTGLGYYFELYATHMTLGYV